LDLPTITSEKLSGKIYLSWSVSIELWFLGQGFHNLLKKGSIEISTSVAQWNKLDIQLFPLLWQSMEHNILGTLRTFRCKSFWKKAQITVVW